MRPIIFLTFTFILFLCSCESNYNESNINEKSADDSLKLVTMVHVREAAMKNKDIPSLMSQFSDDATFINTAGYYYSGKTEIENFHYNLIMVGSVSYYYLAGRVTVRFIDDCNALIYYPWRMDWYNNSNSGDTLYKETGLMTLTAQKRSDKWLWLAITNQHTSEYFDDLIKHKNN